MNYSKEFLWTVAGWTVSVIILPATFSFVAITIQLDKTEARVMAVEELEKDRTLQFRLLRDGISEKLDMIHKDLGEVRGELKRIKSAD